MSVPVSVVIPAFNEASRLPPYLTSVREWFDAQYGTAYEIVVVDDGSRDRTSTVVADLLPDWPNLVIVRHDRQRGKGAAVRSGVLAARGDRILFADADGATPICEETRLRDALDVGYSIAVGSRFCSDSVLGNTRPFARELVGRAFAWLVRRMFRLTVRDTQCGFKMFRRDIALRLFGDSKEAGYLFDLEILARAGQLDERVAEISVSWREIPGSKVRIVRDSFAMLRGLFRLWLDMPKWPRALVRRSAICEHPQLFL